MDNHIHSWTINNINLAVCLCGAERQFPMWPAPREKPSHRWLNSINFRNSPEPKPLLGYTKYVR